MLLKLEGWDNYNNPTTDMLACSATATSPFAWRAGTAGLAFLSPGRLGVGKALQFTTYDWIAGALSSSKVELFHGIGINMPSNTNLGIGFYNSSSQNPLIQTQVSILLNGLSGVATAYRGGSFGSGSSSGTSLGATGGNVFPTGSFFYIETDVVFDASKGGVALNINGVQKLALSLQNTDPAGLKSADSVIIGCLANNSSNGVAVDDMYLADFSTGPGPYPFNSFLGPIQVWTTFPTGAGKSTQFLPHPNTNANWQNVDETAMDSDTTYNETTIIGNIDAFPIGSAIPGGMFVYAAATRIATRQTAAGSHTVKSLLYSGASVGSGADVTGNSNYVYQDDIFPFDPNTKGIWSVTAADATQVGYEPTS